jgi:hypothetical protein
MTVLLDELISTLLRKAKFSPNLAKVATKRVRRRLKHAQGFEAAQWENSATVRKVA